MHIPKTTRDALESLTPKEMEVLRRRFGIDDEDKGSKTPQVTPPAGSGEDEGSGGAPIPANPPA